MNAAQAAPAEPSQDAALVAALFAVDPAGLGGVALRASADPGRDQWLALVKALLPAGVPLRRIPLHISDSALLGGLDLAATLQAGRPVSQRGVLAQADGGVVMLAVAERLSAATAARLAAVLDCGEVLLERDGLALRQPARLGMVALDEGQEDEEQLPAALLDRLAFHLHLQSGIPDSSVYWSRADIEAARLRLPNTGLDAQIVQALCATAQALGVASLRAPLLALRVARAAAALVGEAIASADHATLAARLVLAPRATRLPPPPPPPPDTQPEDADDSAQTPDDMSEPEPPQDASPEPEAGSEGYQALAETVLAATQAAVPAGLLAALQVGQASRAQAQTAGRAGAVRKNQNRGRPIGARRGEPRQGARLNVLETLRAAAPWQTLRRRTRAEPSATRPAQAGQLRIEVRRDDFHVTKFKQNSQTTTIFVVDASGSSALNRLAEAKGAVELLLADCYVRRDQVAVIAFRDKQAELLLPPTRSLPRAKRSLAGLPGGGGTPLASGLDAALTLAQQVQRRGDTPVIVLLTDGRGNIARSGAPGRVQANADAIEAARQIKSAGLTALLLDTSPQAQAMAQTLAQAMGAHYLPLPHAGARQLSQAVKAATGASQHGY